MTGQRWPAYAWSFPIGDGRRNVGYGELTSAGPLRRTHLLERMHELLGDTGAAEVADARAHHLPLSTWRPPAGHGRLLLAGDALSLINPFTGEGIFYAVLSGSLAGQAAVSPGGPAAGQAYTVALRRRLARHLRHTSLVARLTARPWVVDAGMRAAARDQRVFDGFVTLGLGDGLLTPASSPPSPPPPSTAADLAAVSGKAQLRRHRFLRFARNCSERRPGCHVGCFI
ncbi:hypothetical protein ACFQZ4_35360 [Catellatospora coxensis]